MSNDHTNNPTCEIACFDSRELSLKSWQEAGSTTLDHACNIEPISQVEFSDVSYHLGQIGVPLLDNALATLECRVISRYPGGDHSIFIGQVVSTNVAPDKQPLLYFCSKYNKLALSPISLAVGS